MCELWVYILLSVFIHPDLQTFALEIFSLLVWWLVLYRKMLQSLQPKTNNKLNTMKLQNTDSYNQNTLWKAYMPDEEQQSCGPGDNSFLPLLV